MKNSDAISQSERSFSDSAPLPAENQPLGFALPLRGVRARLSAVLWSLGAVIVPFLTMSAYLVLTRSVLMPKWRWYPEGLADYCGGAVAVLLEMCCVWHLPLPLVDRAILLFICPPYIFAALLVYSFLFLGAVYGFSL